MNNMKKLIEAVSMETTEGLGDKMKKVGSLKMAWALRTFVRDGDADALRGVLMNADDRMRDAAVGWGVIKQEKALNSGEDEKAAKYGAISDIASSVTAELEGTDFVEAGDPSMRELMDAVGNDSLDEFTRAYVEAALWSTNDESDNPLDDNYGPEDIADETMRSFIADCEKFQSMVDFSELECARRGQYSVEEMAGHDFWLTRNGHGAGFWDGDWGDDGDRLDELATSFGEVYLYVGDDGKIYQAN